MGDAFQLFPGATAGFTSSSLQSTDTLHNAIYAWSNTVSTDGKVTVASANYIVNPTPINMVTTVSNSVLTLAWPADHTGWVLQAQTNALTKGLGTNWATVTGSAATNRIIVPIAPTNGSVFFRMIYTNFP
jgi:hypothetical protein